MSSSLSLSGYKLTFDFEFAAMSNSDFGLPGTPGITWETEVFYKETSNGGQGTVNPTPPGQPGSLFSLQDGVLVENMTTTQAPYLDTNPNGVPGGFSQQYGYFEVRAQLTDTSGYNSDFWMMPNSGPWPPEFDVYEHNGYIAGDYEMTNHGGDASTPVNNLALYSVPNLTTSFNTFGFMWTPTTLTWSINGQEVFSAPTASNENQPFNLILSGGPSYLAWLPPPLAGTIDQYKIAWVHAYSNDPNAKEIAGMTGYQDHDGSTSLGVVVEKPPVVGTGISYITAGSGSFTDAVGNVYTVDAADNALENGKLMAGGSGTGAMEYANGIVYGQDRGSGTWYTWDQSTWTLASVAPPPPPTAPAPVSVGSGSDTLVLSISEDAYANGDKTSDAAGDATFTVSVDGKQLAGTFTAKASHADGVDQTFTFKGDWAPGGHTVAVNFLNDAWGGTAATDRNLYVDKVTYDGTNINKSATFLRSESQSFAVTDNTALPPRRHRFRLRHAGRQGLRGRLPRQRAVHSCRRWQAAWWNFHRHDVALFRWQPGFCFRRRFRCGTA